MLAPASWRRIASWICGWLFVVGNITITLSVNFGTTLFFVACINVFEKEPGVGVFAGETYQVYLIFLGITFLCNAVSALGNKWLPWLDVRRTPARRDVPLLTLLLDCCHLLDFCRCDCHHGLCARSRQARPPRCQLCLHPLRVQLWVAEGLVFLRWFASCGLCNELHWHDYIVRWLFINCSIFGLL